MSDKKFIERHYFKTFNKRLDLNNPETFTAKMQWLKLYDRNPLYTLCADKYKVRSFVEKEIGKEYLIPLIYASEDPKSIPFDILPSEYIVKTNHTSGYNLIVKQKKMYSFLDSKDYNEKELVKTLESWLKINVFYDNREWEYRDIKPKIIIEKLLQDELGGAVLNDYKIHCFNGIPMYIQTIFDRMEVIKENWFDSNWKPLDLYYFSNEKKIIERPKNLSELLKVAEKLSKKFVYVRVDLYSVNNKILFGELTFHPYGGLMKFKPKSWDLKLGKMLMLGNE